MLSGRSERWIGERRERNFNIRIAREIAILRFVESAFQVIDLRADLDASTEQVAIGLAFERRKIRERGECKIDFREGAHAAIVLDLLDEVRREMRGIYEAHKRAFGVGVRDDGARENFFPGCKDHSGCDAITHANLS